VRGAELTKGVGGGGETPSRGPPGEGHLGLQATNGVRVGKRKNCGMAVPVVSGGDQKGVVGGVINIKLNAFTTRDTSKEKDGQ